MQVKAEPSPPDHFDYDGHICGVLQLTARYFEVETSWMSFPELNRLPWLSQATHQSEEV